MWFRQPYHLAGASFLPLDVGCLFFFAGIQHSPVVVCSATSCNLGFLAGEGEHMSFYSSFLLFFFALISHASKVMLKILQMRLQQYTNQEPPDIQARLKNSRGTRDQIANICWFIEKAREFQKKTPALLTILKALTVWITKICRKFLKRCE